LVNYGEAERWYLEALVSARRASDRTREAGVLSNLALLAKIRGQVYSAVSLLNQAIEIYEDLGEEAQVARCKLNLGIFYSWQGQYQNAKRHLAAATDSFVALKQDSFLVSAHLALAKVHRLSNDMHEASRGLKDLLANPILDSQPRKKVIALEYLADVLVDTGEYEDANVVLLRAIALARDVGPESDVYLECTYRLAVVQSKLGFPAAGVLALADEGVALARSQGDLFELGCALFARGTIAVTHGNSSAAIVDFEECAKLARTTGDAQTHARAVLALSHEAANAGRHLDSLGLAYEAKTLYEGIGIRAWTDEATSWLSSILSSPETQVSRLCAGGRSKPNGHHPRPQLVPEIPQFISSDDTVHEALTMIMKLSPRDLSILLLGESGTGKEIIAEAIHRASGRKGPFVAVNCGALPGDLLEAELFGHAKGAYTGASAERGGLIEHSNLGTLFLDEIGDMPLKAQARLLRALESGEVRRLGENSPRFVNIKIVAATNRNLLGMIANNEFRLDLYHRLAGYTVKIPALRERVGDVDLLIDHFLGIYAKEQDKVVELADGVRAELTRHSWPGNVRQLRNVIHRLVSLSEPGQVVTRLPFELEGVETPRSLPEALDAEERRRIIAALESARWNKAKAARTLGSSRTTLIAKMKRLGIEPPDTGARVR